MLTFPLWKNRLGGDRDIVSKTITLSGERYTVLGVLPKNFQPDPPTDLFLPEQFDPNSTNQGHIYYVAGRLRPGATAAQAQAELAVIADQFRAANPDTMDKTESVAVLPLRVAIGGGGAFCIAHPRRCCGICSVNSLCQCRRSAAGTRRRKAA